MLHPEFERCAENQIVRLHRTSGTTGRRMNLANTLSAGQFRILRHGPGPYDSIQVKVEAAARLPQAQWPASVQILGQTIRNRWGANATVRLIEAGGLPLTDGKTKWIERNAG